MDFIGNLRFGLSQPLPLVLQTEAAECGLACLAMVAGYHQAGVDLAELRRRFGVSLKGSRLSDLTRVSDRLDLATRPLRLELHELSQLQTPCILHWDLNHFVVLASVRGNQVMIHDPALGQRRMSLQQLSNHFRAWHSSSRQPTASSPWRHPRGSS